MSRRGRNLARMLLVVAMLGQSVMLSGCAIPPIITQLLQALGVAPAATTQPGTPGAAGAAAGVPPPANGQAAPPPQNGAVTLQGALGTR